MIAYISLLLAAAPGCSDDDKLVRSSPGGGGVASGGVGGAAGASGAAGTGGAPLPEISQLISLHPDSIYESEPHIAADGRGHLVAAWIALAPTPRVAYGVSADDGATWSVPRFAPDPGLPRAGDPAVAVDRDGRFFLAWLAFSGPAGATPNDGRVVVAQIDPQTAGAGPFRTVSDSSDATRSLDKPWIASTPSGVLIIAWVDLANSRTWVARSTDGGDNFETTVVQEGSQEFAPALCADPANDNVYLLTWRDQVYRSGDGGLSWKLAAGDPDDSGTPAPQMLSCAAKDGQLWVAYGDGTGSPGGPTSHPANQVHVVRSTDGGESFQENVTASGPLPPVGFLDHLNYMLVPHDDGILDLLYYVGEEGGPATLERSISRDGGLTFARRTHALPGTYTNSRSSQAWLGDYLGVAVSTHHYATFADNSGALGRSHIRFTRSAR